MTGRVLGHYTVIEQIGEGGMGVVYRARDERLERDVALKVLSTGSLGTDQARSQRRKEALALAQLNHAHIGAVYDFDTQDGVDFLVMESSPERRSPTGSHRRSWSSEKCSGSRCRLPTRLRTHTSTESFTGT